MRPDWMKPAVLIASAIASGWVGWSGHMLLLPAAAVFPVLWSHAGNRVTATGIAAAYFLAASRGLPQGVATFYASDLWPGLLLWIGACLSFVAVHAALWTSNEKTRPLRYLIAMVLLALPPFGITGWAHPLTAAGVLFAGWGWWGLGAMTAGLMGLVSRISPAVAIALSALWLWSAASVTPQIVIDGWHGVDLNMGASLGRDTSLSRQRDLIATAKSAAGGEADIVVLPESTLGFWTPTVARLWRGGLEGMTLTVIAGAASITRDGYENVMVAVSAREARIVYRERMPVPVSMWRPWDRWRGQPGGAHASFFANPVVEVAGKKIAPIICYEQLVVWPLLQSILHRPDAVVLIGNGWWTAGTSIVAIQRMSAQAWAQLFGIPLVMSFNT